MCTLDGKRAKADESPVGGLHKTANDYVVIHDTFRHHAEAALKILGLSWTASGEEVDLVLLRWKAIDLETAAAEQNAVIAALRSYNH